MNYKILLIDDDPSFNKKMKYAFDEYDIRDVLSIKDAYLLLEKLEIDLILLDLNFDPESEVLEGLSYIEPLKQSQINIPLIVVTADKKTDTVVQAMKCGANDFLRKSEFDMLSWKRKFELVIENKSLNEKIRNLQEEKFPFIGSSQKIDQIKQTLKALAVKPDITVLLTGETGVGKEVAARYLHKHGPRSDKPFVPVHLSAIQESLIESFMFGHKKGAFTGAQYDRLGYFRKAEGGILFLDEIGNINEDLQIKLLRFLESKVIQVIGEDQERELNVQIVAATNLDLKSAVDSEKFRSDLYYRLRNFEVNIPPLRERKEDIKEILSFYLTRDGYESIGQVIENNLLDFLLKYPWPGNIREMKNVVESMILKAKILRKKKVDKGCIPPEICESGSTDINTASPESSGSIKEKTTDTELAMINKALRNTYGQKQRAAELVDLNADQLRYRVLKHWRDNREIVKKYSAIIKNYKLE